MLLKNENVSIEVMIPTKMFFTKGVGVHKDKLASFELALRMAGIEVCNLVRVSSIFPSGCRLISKEAGLGLLKPGQITFVVMAKNETDEPNLNVSAAIGLAMPKNNDSYGYLAEHTSFEETASKARDYAEDLAATMLAMTLGIEPDSEATSSKILKTSVCQSAKGNTDGLWTTVVAVAVFIM
jgi:arginine decarboxylase